MPPRNAQLEFGAPDLRAIEGDGKADAGIQEQVVVSKIVHPPRVVRQVESGNREQPLRETSFEEMTEGWPDRQPHHIVVEALERRGTGEQQVFNRRCLE